MDINKKIVYLREAKGWSQRELADRVNINVSVMNRIELGDRPIRDQELKAIADVLGVSTDFLLGRSEDPELNEIDYQSALLKYQDLIEALDKMPPKTRQRNMQRIQDFVRGLTEADN